MLPRVRELDTRRTKSQNLESIYEPLSPFPNHPQLQDSSQSANSTCFTPISSSMSLEDSTVLDDNEFLKVDPNFSEGLGGDETKNLDMLATNLHPDHNIHANSASANLAEESNTIVQESHPSKNSLMALLSGSQKSKKIKQIQKGPTAEIIEQVTSQEPANEKEDIIDKAVTSDIDACIDDSFTESKSNDLRREHEMIELEKKFYNDNTKSVTPRDFLAQLSQKNVVNKYTDSRDEQNIPISIDENDEDEPILIEIDSDENKNDIQILESKIFSSTSKRTSAKDIFLTFKPLPTLLNKAKQKSSNTNNNKRSHIISLKLKPETLNEIQKATNPLFTKGNDQMTPISVNAKSYLEIMQSSTKRKQLVTLKVDPDKLREATKEFNNPLFSRGTIGLKGKSSNNLFKAMMENASSNIPKLSSLQKLKELYPPVLSRDQFHVCPPDDKQNQDNTANLIQIPKKCRDKHRNLDFDILHDKSALHNLSNIKQESRQYKIEYETYSNKDIFLESIRNIIPFVSSEGPILKLYNRFLETSVDYKNKDSLLWTSLFQPQQMSDVLISPQKQREIQTWIINAFARLKSQALKTPRNVLIKQQKRQKKNNYSALDDFIVDDYVEQDGSETEEDVFVPLLIIQGPVGSCKSSSVYAALDEMNGYVYEINSGQPRGKKDILGTLKEMCTTHLVHRRNEEKEFQKGIVLLEDCDVLFEQDKNFWSAVQEVLNISRRPLIITCNDLRGIPQSIIEFANDDDAIVYLDEQKDNKLTIIKDYLQLCCITQGYQIEGQVLDDILEECCTGSYDLRKALTACQMLCQKYPFNESGESKGEIVIRKICYNRKEEKRSEEHLLDEIANRIDLLSTYDIISSNSFSLINHQEIPNELLDIPFIDESTKLKQRTLPYELNIGDHIHQYNYANEAYLGINLSFNRIREATTTFIGSRTKLLPKLLQDIYSVRSIRASTRSMTDSSECLNEWERDTTGIPDSSICNTLSPSPYILELAPYTRQWCHYQNSLNIVEDDTLKKLGVSVKKFIGWRQFQDSSQEVLNTFI